MMNQEPQRKPEKLYLSLTLAMLATAQEALKQFEQALERADLQPPAQAKVAFAEETLSQLKGKLEGLAQPGGRMNLTTFDSNEKILLTAALQLYTLHLLACPLHPRRASELRLCEQMAAYFTVKHPVIP